MVRGGLLFGAFVQPRKTKALGLADEPRDSKYSLAIASAIYMIERAVLETSYP